MSTLSYYDTELVMTAKGFTLQAPGANPIKCFTTIIYRSLK